MSQALSHVPARPLYPLEQLWGTPRQPLPTHTLLCHRSAGKGGTGLQPPMRLHLLGLLVSRQGSFLGAPACSELSPLERERPCLSPCIEQTFSAPLQCEGSGVWQVASKVSAPGSWMTPLHMAAHLRSACSLHKLIRAQDAGETTGETKANTPAPC